MHTQYWGREQQGTIRHGQNRPLLSLPAQSQPHVLQVVKITLCLTWAFSGEPERTLGTLRKSLNACRRGRGGQ